MKICILRSALWLFGKDELEKAGWSGETSSELSGCLDEKWVRKERMDLGITYEVIERTW